MPSRLPSVLLLLTAAGALQAATLLPDEQNTISVFKEAATSVVFVTNVAVTRSPFTDEQAVRQGTGSGFVWDHAGHIVTNYHVVEGGSAFLVTLGDQTHLEARLVGTDPAKDIAVLQCIDRSILGWHYKTCCLYYWNQVCHNV